MQNASTRFTETQSLTPEQISLIKVYNIKSYTKKKWLVKKKKNLKPMHGDPFNVQALRKYVRGLEDAVQPCSWNRSILVYLMA